MTNVISISSKKLSKNLKNFCKFYANKSPALTTFNTNMRHHDFIAIASSIFGFNGHKHLQKNISRDSVCDIPINLVIDSLNNSIFSHLDDRNKSEWAVEESQFKSTLHQYLLHNKEYLEVELSRLKATISRLLTVEEKKVKMNEGHCDFLEHYRERHILLKRSDNHGVLFDHRSIPCFYNTTNSYDNIKNKITLLDDVRNAFLIKNAISRDIELKDLSDFYYITVEQSEDKNFSRTFSYELALLATIDSKKHHFGLDLSPTREWVRCFKARGGIAGGYLNQKG